METQENGQSGALALDAWLAEFLMIKYPKYRVSQWLDTSEESMSKPEADIVFGVQTQRFKGGAWMHVSQNGKALFFKTDEDATKACESLLANDRSSATPEKMP